MTRKIRISFTDPEARAIWTAILRAKAETAEWPAWKKGDWPREEETNSQAKKTPEYMDNFSQRKNRNG